MNKAEILVIDDEPAIQKLLEITLESNGYKVVQATNGRDGIVMAANHPPDLILLDIGLPDKSGHEILLDLKKWYTKSIIILSVLNNEKDIVLALDNGASDYLTKPFRTGELLARVRLAIRRNMESVENPVAVVGDLQVDFISRIVKKDQLILKLTATEYKLMELFVKNEGKVLTHAYILKEIWGLAYQQETQYLRVFVGQLRKKIESDPNHPTHIITESGVGYRFA